MSEETAMDYENEVMRVWKHSFISGILVGASSVCLILQIVFIVVKVMGGGGE